MNKNPEEVCRQQPASRARGLLLSGGAPSPYLLGLIDALKQAGRHKKALALAETAAKLGPADPLLARLRIELLSRLRRWRECRLRLQEFLGTTLNDEDSVFYRYMGRLAAGDYPGAAGEGERLLDQADSRLINSLFALSLNSEEPRASLLLHKARLSGAGAALKKSPWYALWTTLLDYNLELGPAAFTRCSGRLAFFKGRYGWMRYLPGEAALAAGDLDRAAGHLRAAVGSRQGNWLARCLLGETLACLGQGAASRR